MRMRTLAIAVVVVVLVGLVLGGWMLVRAGGFGARTEPTAIERSLAGLARRWSLPPNARNAINPVAFSPQVWAEARAHFADHCASCHANDGSGQTEMGRNMYPRAPDMRLEATQRLTDGELYWIVENGVRLTGMPAWGDGTDHDTDTWKLVHFVRHLGQLTPDHLKEMEALNPKSPAELAEEHEDDQFLAGAADEAGSSDAAAHHHHQQKEKP